MPTTGLGSYYDATVDSQPREALVQAVKLVTDPRIAIDCGCGAGSDIPYLREHGFRVYGFDIETEAIERCRSRFSGDGDVTLEVASFSSFNCPRASLIIADARLFFCTAPEFPTVWRRITSALLPGGIFAGSFLGPKDSMAQADYGGAPFLCKILDCWTRPS